MTYHITEKLPTLTDSYASMPTVIAIGLALMGRAINHGDVRRMMSYRPAYGVGLRQVALAEKMILGAVNLSSVFGRGARLSLDSDAYLTENRRVQGPQPGACYQRERREMGRELLRRATSDGNVLLAATQRAADYDSMLIAFDLQGPIVKVIEPATTYTELRTEDIADLQHQLKPDALHFILSRPGLPDLSGIR